MSDPNTPNRPQTANGSAKEPGRTEPDKKMSEAAAAGQPEAPTGPTDEDLDTAAADVAADVTAVLAAEVETLQAQIADLTDRLLRAHADLDNLRKRAEREKQDAARYAISNFAKDTVGLVDNFERAMQAVEPTAIENDPHLKSLLDGVSMTEREFLNVLERHGVKRVFPKGDMFDPRLHQAVMERQDASVASGTVVEVFQSGYTIAERCLRPAMVVVARGGGKAQPKTEPKPEAKPEPAETTVEASAEPADQQPAEGPAETAAGTAPKYKSTAGKATPEGEAGGDKDAAEAGTDPQSDNDNPKA